MQHKKKIFPKFQKSLKNFLTDESGKITKKDALGISAGAALFAGVDETIAAHTNTSTPSLPFPVSDPRSHSNGPQNFQFVQVTWATCNHASGLVNGHYSSIPTVNPSQTVYDVQSHGSHGSHGSHWSWGWC